MRFIVPLVAALVPLLITPGWFSHFDITPKIAILLCGLPLILLYENANVHNFYKLIAAREGRWFAGLLGAQWAAAALATMLSSHGALSLNGSSWRRFGLASETGLLLFVLLAAGWLVAEQENVRLLLHAVTVSGALASLYGIAQYFGWDPLLPAKAYQAGESPFTIVRPPGTLGHADYFAAWLVVVTFLALALARLESPGWRSYAALAMAALGTIAIILSGTRAAMLGLVVGAGAYILVLRTRVRARALMASVACAAGLVVFFFSPAGAKLRARLHWSMEDIRGGTRMLLWRDSLGMAAHRPVWGFGPETFATEFPRYESKELARAYPAFYSESPHNIFLDALTAEGVLGLGALLGLAGLGIWAAVRSARARSRLAAPLAAALAGLLIAQQFTVFAFTNALYFYLVIALLIADLPRVHVRKEGSIKSPRLWSYMALAVGLVLLGFAVRLLVADAALAIAQRRIAAGDANGAARAYRVVIQWQLSGATSDLDYSRAMQQLAMHTPIFTTRLSARQQALEAGIRAVGTAEDRQNAWYNLSILLAARHDVDGVERSLRNAIAWSPNWFKPHWALAQLLDLAGHRAEALKEDRDAVDLDGGQDAEVTDTLRKLEAGGGTQR
jgi:O-antigen ligase